MNPQLIGLEDLPGTDVFDLATSVRTLRINRFFHQLAQASQRERLRQDEGAAMREAGLSEHEQQLVRTRDWIGLLRHGVNFLVLEKFARVLRLSNLEVYAAMRGESLDEFLKTRRVPDAR